MSLITKQSILDAIRRTAKENDGIPLGQGRFEKETGINSYACQKYWSTFGEAQREAGFTANTLKVAHNKEFVFENLIALMRELDKFPTEGNLVVKRNKDPKFPSPGSIKRLGNKKEIAEKISEYAKQKGYEDILKLCRAIIENSNEEKDSYDFEVQTVQTLGEVYLFKSGRYYKIGKTNDTVRRGSELRIQLPEKMDLIHSIKTDDPSGVEAY